MLQLIEYSTLTKVLLIVMIKLNTVLLYFLAWAKGVRTSEAFHHEDESETTVLTTVQCLLML